MNKKERLSAFNRNNILTAAKKLFEEKGITQTTMDDISKEADYSKSTVYAYFKSKDEICSFIKLEYFELLKTAVSEALENDSGFPDGFYAICNTLMKFYKEYPLFFEIVLDEVRLPDGKSDTVLFRLYEVGEEINDIIENYLEECIAKNQIHLDLPPKQATFVLWAYITGIITMAHNKEPYINMEMKISKEDFMHNGFRLLQKSIKK